MTKPVDVIFTGEIAQDKTIPEVCDALAKLFKTEPSQLKHWFSGQRIKIKKNIDLQQGQTYLKAMANTGAIAYLEDTSQDVALSWQVAEAGSDVLRPEEITRAAPVKVDTSAYRTLDNSELVIEEAHSKPLEVDTSALSILPSGTNLQDLSSEATNPPFINTTALEILPQGPIDNLPSKTTPISPNTDHLQLE